MEQLAWIMEAIKNKFIKINGFYKLVSYTYENSIACNITVWCKTYERCGNGPYDYDEIDDDRKFKVSFKPDGSIKEIKEI